MFQPNVIGSLEILIGRDVHNRPEFAAPVQAPFAEIDFDEEALKTSVRADSSASRGAADEIVGMHAQILVPPEVRIKIGDRFSFDGSSYQVVGTQRMRSVLGVFDHTEVTLRILP